MHTHKLTRSTKASPHSLASTTGSGYLRTSATLVPSVQTPRQLIAPNPARMDHWHSRAGLMSTVRDHISTRPAARLDSGRGRSHAGADLTAESGPPPPPDESILLGSDWSPSPRRICSTWWKLHETKLSPTDDLSVGI